ncbi:MAG TPA: hypothetical protein VM840_12990, partial [Actinomycetota bacterium]|nr:hypothetical protein [Actinomycetota bacterium]
HDFGSGTGSVVVTREGGRVAELRCGEDGPNLLYEGEAPVAGGDRLWPAPEVEVFYDEAGRWRVPREVDPGSWTMEMDGPVASLEQSAVGMRMSRRVRALDRPPLQTSMPWAGYEVADAVSGAAGRSAWHLVMLPTPQDIYVRAHGDPVAYYAPIPALREGWLSTGTTGDRWKLGFAPPGDGRVLLAAMGRDDPGPLVVLASQADPSGTYVDVPPTGGPATAVQVFEAVEYPFCEIEHHAPLETGETRAVVAAVWGSREDRLDWLSRLPP